MQHKVYYIMEREITDAAEKINEADALLIGAGAGIGVDSGLPDFRGNKGFWKAYPPMKKLGVSFSDMANPVWFEEKPYFAWGFYGHRLNLYRKTTPHHGFEQLLQLGRNMPDEYFVYTSNVDGQFQKAGFDPERIVEAHGSIHHLQCVRPCTDSIWKADDIGIHVNEETMEAKGSLPECQYCNNIARPNILMFSDWAWIPQRSAEQEQRMQEWLDELGNKKLVIIEIGAGSAVPTVRVMSERLVSIRNADLIRINPRESGVPKGQVSLARGAADAIDKIMNAL